MGLILHGAVPRPAGRSRVISFRAMLTVALIFGGRSAEHEISLASARFVADNLDPAEYRIVPVGILPNGAWVLPEDLAAALRDGAPDEVLADRIRGALLARRERHDMSAGGLLPMIGVGG